MGVFRMNKSVGTPSLNPHILLRIFAASFIVISAKSGVSHEYYGKLHEMSVALLKARGYELNRSQRKITFEGLKRILLLR
jgi:hypothetical protein